MLTLTHFKKSFGNEEILNIPSITMEKGIHWIKGKNGSGKSTLFNCLAGLSPCQGEIKLNTLDLKRSPEQYKLKVNYSQSEPVFPDFLTGNDLIQFFAKLKKAPESQPKFLMNLLSVEGYANKPFGTYSSGMAKKLSVLLAFLGSPEWIILDEPLITLDTNAQKIVSEMIAKAYEEGVSFIFATHQDFDNALIEATHSYFVEDKTLMPEK